MTVSTELARERVLLSKAMLDAREERFRAERLLASGGNIVISLALNLPGGHAYYPWWAALLLEGARYLESRIRDASLHVLTSEQREDAAGPYWQYVLMMPDSAGRCAYLKVKQIAASVEEGHPIGRLLDIDVLDREARPVSRVEIGLPPRACYVCSRPAHECRVNNRHSAAEVRRAAERLWLRPLASEIGRGALAGMLLEAAAWPAPGLVSPLSSGSHHDMNYTSFLLSSSAIAAGFSEMAALGLTFALERKEDSDLASLLWRMRATGLYMEQLMFDATAGANTHRGLIFMLGLACVAVGVSWGRLRLSGDASRPSPGDVAQVVANITQGLTDRELSSIDPKNTSLSRGQRLYLETGLKGVRGEAEGGLQSVLCAGLPALREALGRVPLEDALVHSLVSLMSVAEDSALAGRHSVNSLKRVVWPLSRKALALGSVFTPEGRHHICFMCDEFERQNLNPGGSADLLCVTIAMHIWERGYFPREQLGFARRIVPGLWASAVTCTQTTSKE